ncbi:zinc finger BED domain-containing protein 1-like [Fundulus heteroclitus]|uniref:zinc finger BED domain-containing protein 1-like n=1 Tax=Fundulus heteroclitus TaxID=8078 RepID=UPI00165AC3A6|nr:zinc finger BED domain-containing protein 1-like [Fundulus heteroclitus]
MAEKAEVKEEVGKTDVVKEKEDDLHTPCGFKSFVWKHFGFRKDGKKLMKDMAICRYCRCEIRYCGNTSNLSAHLRRRHGVQGEEKAQPSTSPLTKFFPQKFSHSSKRAVNISKAIAFFICTDIRPYCVVENEGFRYLLDTLEPRYCVPSRQHFSESLIPKLYAKVRDVVIQALHEAQRVAVTCDGWTSCTTESFITVTCHFIDHGWEMHNNVLQTRVLADTHSGANIGHVLRAACEEWGLSDKAPALVTDNASNMKRAGQEAGMSPHIMCFAHTLNLSTQDGLKITATDRLLGRVRRIVSFFHRSSIATTVYKEKQKLLDLPSHKLKADVKTRWNSSFEMLERFLEQQPAVTATLLDKKLRKGASDIHALTESDLSTAEQMVSLLAPLKAVTTLMCEEKQPTVSVIAPLRTKLLTHFECAPDDTPLIKDMKRVMAEDLRERYVDEEPFLLRAAALDPRFKKLPFLSDERRNQTFECIAEEAVQLKEQRNESEAQDQKTPPHAQMCDVWETKTMEEKPPVSKKTKVLDDLFGDSFSTEDQSFRKKTSKELANDEIRKYRDIASLSLGGKVLEWWKAHQAEFPLLADLAKTYLCIPGTSVPSERVFSTAGDIVRSERSVLSAEHVDQLIFLKKNLSRSTIESIEL